MLESAPAPTSPGLSNSVSATSSLPASRTRSRLGLSYLRNYTQTHLLSREHSSNNHGASGNSTGSQQQQSTASASALVNSHNSSSAFGRFSSYSPTNPSSPASPTSSRGGGGRSPSLHSNRLSLVSSASHPLASPSAGSGPQHQNHQQPSNSSSHPTNTYNTSTTANSVNSGQRPIVAGRRSTESSVAPPIVTATAALGTIGNLGGSDADKMTRTRSATTTDAVTGGADALPSIRFSAFYDARAPRPSLSFSPISRTLPTGGEVIRVGRYSERDNQPAVPANVPSAAPVGFKSKVVSRRHCEFWCEGGKWFIKDVKSSSGTFLNHIRLSPPGNESRPFPVNDGDIVQLGIDFKGGEEMIFRCVKMRLELNRGWQNKLNTFNMATHKRLRNMTSSSGAGSASSAYSQDCSICLNRIAPCQCLFVAPCSHTWHYKCIRPVLTSPQFPIFQCPNCRAAADLDADIEDVEEWEMESDDGDQPQDGASLQVQGSNEAPPRKSRESARSVRSVRSQRSARIREAQAQAQAQQSQPIPALPTVTNGDVTMIFSPPDHPMNSSRPALSQMAPHATSDPLPIPSMPTPQRPGGTRTPSPPGGPGNGHEGPITPRNDAGPWVFDGSGARINSDSATGGKGDAHRTS